MHFSNISERTTSDDLNERTIDFLHCIYVINPVGIPVSFFPSLSSLTHLPPISLSLHLLTFGGEQMEIVAGSVKPEAAKEMGFL